MKRSAPKKYAKPAAKRANVRAMVRAKPRVDLFSSMLPHYFRRSFDDGVVHCSGAGTIGCTDSTGSTPGWYSQGTVAADVGGAATTGQFGFSVLPTLNLLPSPTELTNLFLRYQVTKITVKITPVMADAYNGSVGCPLPYVTSVIDYGDATPPATQRIADQYENAQQFQLTNDRTWSRSCRPKPASIVYNSAVSVGYGYVGQGADLWLDTGNGGADVPHYGPKFFVRNFFYQAAGGGIGFRIQPTFEFRMREAH